MGFLKANAKGMLVGFSTVILWAMFDWFAAKHGLPFGRDRNYSETFFAATAGASAVLLWQTQ